MLLLLLPPRLPHGSTAYGNCCTDGVDHHRQRTVWEPQPWLPKEVGDNPLLITILHKLMAQSIPPISYRFCEAKHRSCWSYWEAEGSLGELGLVSDDLKGFRGTDPSRQLSLLTQ